MKSTQFIRIRNDFRRPFQRSQAIPLIPPNFKRRIERREKLFSTNGLFFRFRTAVNKRINALFVLMSRLLFIQLSSLFLLRQHMVQILFSPPDITELPDWSREELSHCRQRHKGFVLHRESSLHTRLPWNIKNGFKTFDQLRRDIRKNRISSGIFPHLRRFHSETNCWNAISPADVDDDEKVHF